jgi:hypothetical protein
MYTYYFTSKTPAKNLQKKVVPPWRAGALLVFQKKNGAKDARFRLFSEFIASIGFRKVQREKQKIDRTHIDLNFNTFNETMYTISNLTIIIDT